MMKIYLIIHLLLLMKILHLIMKSLKLLRSMKEEEDKREY